MNHSAKIEQEGELKDSAGDTTKMRPGG